MIREKHAQRMNQSEPMNVSTKILEFGTCRKAIKAKDMCVVAKSRPLAKDGGLMASLTACTRREIDSS